MQIYVMEKEATATRRKTMEFLNHEEQFIKFPPKGFHERLLSLLACFLLLLMIRKREAAAATLLCQ